jgi:SAM-dependent methyltransferase
MLRPDCARLVEHAEEKWASHFNVSSVRTQYESFPYPWRDPSQRAFYNPGFMSESSLSVANHFLFNGNLDLALAFRVLVVGCGTGDQAMRMVAELVKAGAARFTVVCLDISRASLGIAEARLLHHGRASGDAGGDAGGGATNNKIQLILVGGSGRERNTTDKGTTPNPRAAQGRVFVHHGSLLDEDLSSYGLFHFIVAVGVLHHLPDPVAGVLALKRWLHPSGGMGVMVYGTHGRRGVYDLQKSMRHLALVRTQELAAAAATAVSAAATAAADAAVAAGADEATAAASAATATTEAVAAENAATKGGDRAWRLRMLTELLHRLPRSHALHGYLENAHVWRGYDGNQKMELDTELFDLFLHSQDQAYDVQGVADLAKDGGMALADFIPLASYDPLNQMLRGTPKTSAPTGAAGAPGRELEKTVRNMPWLNQAILAENLQAQMHQHRFFLVHAPPSRCPRGRIASRRVLLETASDEELLTFAPQLRDSSLRATLRKSGATLNINLGTLVYQPYSPSLSRDVVLPLRAKEIIDMMSDSENQTITVGDMYERWVAQRRAGEAGGVDREERRGQGGRRDRDIRKGETELRNEFVELARATLLNLEQLHLAFLWKTKEGVTGRRVRGGDGGDGGDGDAVGAALSTVCEI